MVGALVEHLGEPAAGAPTDGLVRTCVSHAGSHGRSGEDFYRDVVRAGYRGPYLISLAGSVADGRSTSRLGTPGPTTYPTRR